MRFVKDFLRFSWNLVWESTNSMDFKTNEPIVRHNEVYTNNFYCIDKFSINFQTNTHRKTPGWRLCFFLFSLRNVFFLNVFSIFNFLLFCIRILQSPDDYGSEKKCSISIMIQATKKILRLIGFQNSKFNYNPKQKKQSWNTINLH